MPGQSNRRPSGLPYAGLPRWSASSASRDLAGRGHGMHVAPGQARRGEHLSEVQRSTISVVVGRLESLVGYGVGHVLGGSSRVRVLGTDLEGVELERFVMNEEPQVAILGEAVEYALLLRLKACMPAMGVVVVAPDPGRLCGEMLVDAGVGWLALNASEFDLLTAVRVAACGERAYLRAAGDEVAVVEAGESLLTDRETEVFERLSEGLTNPEIAGALHISVGTVGTHVRKIFRKLGVRKRQQLIGTRVSEPKRDAG